MPDSSLGPDLDLACEVIVLDFERSRGAGHPFDLTAALNRIEPSLRPRLAAELACIDLERSCDGGSPPVVSAIVCRFAELFESEATRAVVAHEHFRLCCVLGTPISREALASLYNVAPSKLPARPSTHAQPLNSRDIAYPEVGHAFCNYPLIAELGRGALARVYLAHQPDLAQRLVVLKVTQRLTAEADKLARLQHSGIIPVYSIHKHGELTCICMPYLGALTLADLLEDGRLLSQKEKTPQGLVSTIVWKRLSTIANRAENAKDIRPAPCELAIEPHAPSSAASFSPTSLYVPSSAEQFSEQLGTAELIESLNKTFVERGPIVASVELITKVAEALAYAHQRSIVHRDLKPENILVANDGQPILLDFNLASAVNDDRCDIAGGTLPYMSPQHLRSLNTNGQAAASDDVFSVGVILYQLLAGKLPFELPPFAAQNLEEHATQRANLPANPRTLNSDIAPSLASIVMKCLAFNASDRYPSAAELVEDLQCYSNNQVLRYAPDRSVVERARKWVHRHPIITSSSSLLACFGLIVGALACALMLSWSRAERLLSQQAAQSLPVQMGAVITRLQSPGREPVLLREGIKEGRAIVDTWLDEDEFGVRLKPIINRLDPEQAVLVKRQLRKLLFVMESAALQLNSSDAEDREQLLTDASRWKLLTNIIEPGPHQANKTDDQDDLFINALNARDQKKFSRWKELAEQLLVQQPTDPSHWFTLGAAHWTLGEFASARHAFDVSSKLQTGSAIAIFWRGVCELQLGNANEAKSDFGRCIEIIPGWMPALYNRALAARTLWDNAGALRDVGQIIENGQATTRVFSLQSQLYHATGDETQAIASRQLAMETVPQDADDWVARGMLQIRVDPAAAHQDFAHARTLNPTSTAAIQNIAHIQSELTHQYAAAIDTLSELMQLRPTSATPIASRGIILGRDGQYAAAMADAHAAESLQPDAMEMLQIAGIYSLASEKRPDRIAQGMSWLAKAVALNPAIRSIAAADPDLSNLKEVEQFRTLTSPSPK